MKYKTIRIDLAKNIFQVCALDNNRNVKMNKKVIRKCPAIISCPCFCLVLYPSARWQTSTTDLLSHSNGTIPCELFFLCVNQLIKMGYDVVTNGRINELSNHRRIFHGLYHNHIVLFNFEIPGVQ